MTAKSTAGVTASTTSMAPTTLTEQVRKLETVLPRLVSRASVSLRPPALTQDLLDAAFHFHDQNRTVEIEDGLLTVGWHNSTVPVPTMIGIDIWCCSS